MTEGWDIPINWEEKTIHLFHHKKQDKCVKWRKWDISYCGQSNGISSVPNSIMDFVTDKIELVNCKKCLLLKEAD